MAEKSKVTRIKASDDSSKKATTRTKAAKPATVKSKKVVTNTAESIEAKRNIFVRIGGYFKGAWQELRQVRWPNRRATWSLTLAVVLFSAFFVVLILLLDTLFQYVFKTLIA